MQLLLAAHPAPVSEAEIVREIGDRIEVEDALRYLHGRGLAHRLGGDADIFWWATRTAIAGEEVVTLRFDVENLRR